MLLTNETWRSFAGSPTICLYEALLRIESSPRVIVASDGDDDDVDVEVDVVSRDPDPAFTLGSRTATRQPFGRSVVSRTTELEESFENKLA